MKKLIFTSIVMSLISATAMAQSPIPPPSPWEPVVPGFNHYPFATGTIIRSGYTYKYRNGIISGVENMRSIELYNASTTFLDMEWEHKDGTPLSEGEALGYYHDPYYFSYSSQTYDQLRALVRGCFTSQQKKNLRESSMIIQARIDPSTGKVADVYFYFRRDEPLMTIAVETYRSIELAIKQNLTITATTAGQKFNYIEFIWEQKF